MNARLLAALLLAVAACAPAAAASSAKHSSLRVVVSTLLRDARSNFTALRLQKIDSDADFTEYKTKRIGAFCSTCKMYDAYARGTYKENWYVRDEWDTPAKPAPKGVEATIVRELRPLLPGFSFHRTPLYKGSKYAYLTWRNAHGIWVRAQTYDGGYIVRVGHDLEKPVHVLLPPTQTQLSALTQAVTQFVRLGSQSAAANFASLRSKGPRKDEMGNERYAADLPMGPVFHSCDITHVANGFGYSDFQPKWVLSCQTSAMAGTDKTLRETLRSGVLDALPYGFNLVTDSNDLLLADYDWDNAETMQSISILGSEENGVVRFTIDFYHFLPKPRPEGS